MGFFDRLLPKKNPPARPVTSTPTERVTEVGPAAAVTPAVESSSGSGASPNPVIAQLVAARARLDAQDLPGALAIYESVLTGAGDRPDVLVAISGDLGSTGNIAPIVELIAPRYDAERHGPATGLNLLQAYLALRNTTAARHLLDVLFALNRADLQERLFGFSNALAELLEAERHGQLAPPSTGATDGGVGSGAAGTPASNPGTGARVISLASISKPIWSYGLEPLGEQVLPSKGPRVRRVAFAQLALPGYPDAFERMKKPEDELGRFSRGFALWMSETFYYAPHYAPIAAVGMVNESKHYALFPAEWTTENLRQLVESSGDGLDYIFTGALRQVSGDTEVLIRVWEVKKFRERKQFTARWTPATADLELAKLHEQIRFFMEWTAYPAGQGLVYRAPLKPSAWIDVLGSSLTLFLADKGLLGPDQLASVPPVAALAADHASHSEAHALAWLTLQSRMKTLGVSIDVPPGPLPVTPAVQAASQLLS